jgi:hypothetical protein
MDSGIDKHDEYFVREMHLLQHENNYTEEEFNEIVQKYEKYSVWNIKQKLKENHGFRLVPIFKL